MKPLDKSVVSVSRGVTHIALTTPSRDPEKEPDNTRERNEYEGETLCTTDTTDTTNNNNNLYSSSVGNREVVSVDWLTITIPGTARGKERPRFSRGGGRPHTAAKTVRAEDHIRAHAIEQVGQPCLEGALTLDMVVTVPVPRTWPESRRRQALEGLERPTGKPDADNLLKTVMDALNGCVWRDDAQIVDATVRKFYGSVPGTKLVIGRPM